MSVASWCCKSLFVVPCASFCTGHFVMVPLNMTYLHCLQHSLFEHLFNLYVYVYEFTMGVQLNNNLHNLLAIVFIIDTQHLKDADGSWHYYLLIYIKYICWNATVLLYYFNYFIWTLCFKANSTNYTLQLL